MFEGVECEDEIGTIIREWQRRAIHVGLDMYARKQETVHTNKAGQSAGATAQVDTHQLTGMHLSDYKLGLKMGAAPDTGRAATPCYNGSVVSPMSVKSLAQNTDLLPQS